jgi:hypothetical protein
VWFWGLHATQVTRSTGTFMGVFNVRGFNIFSALHFLCHYSAPFSSQKNSRNASSLGPANALAGTGLSVGDVFKYSALQLKPESSLRHRSQCEARAPWALLCRTDVCSELTQSQSLLRRLLLRLSLALLSVLGRMPAIFLLQHSCLVGHTSRAV